MSSARFDGDTWDLASSVGLTATTVAAARAVAARDPEGAGAVATDRSAEPLVRAVGVDFFTRMATGELDAAELDEETAIGMRHSGAAMAIRTRFFDDFFLDATASGIVRPSSWLPAWTRARTGCPGRRAPRCSKSISHR